MGRQEAGGRRQEAGDRRQETRLEATGEREATGDGEDRGQRTEDSGDALR